MVDSEKAELRLSYLSACGSEKARKQSGSYYTPADVALFFWREFFGFHGLHDRKTGLAYLRSHRFVEPAAGAGALIFALLHRFAALGVLPAELAEIELHVIDVNKRALNFIKKQFAQVAADWGVDFKGINFVCADFRTVKFDHSDKPAVIFGNPPFVSNPPGTSNWKNLFADFVELSLKHAGAKGTLHFILPLSLAFSRDFRRLRNMLTDQTREVVFSHFDNIPDTLFKSGKPEHTNTNKANSQRCSIVTARPSEVPRVLSTELHRWSRLARASRLSQSPIYYDVSSFRFDDQVPRPVCRFILDYLDKGHGCTRFGDLVSPNGAHELHLAAVARNFIGVREEPTPGSHILRFEAPEDFYRALLLLTSDIFYAYWRTIGDGFHITRANVLGFPISPELHSALSAQVPAAMNLWAARISARKGKKNAGRPIYSYDFSALTPSFMPLC